MPDKLAMDLQQGYQHLAKRSFVQPTYPVDHLRKEAAAAAVSRKQNAPAPIADHAKHMKFLRHPPSFSCCFTLTVRRATRSLVDASLTTALLSTRGRTATSLKTRLGRRRSGSSRP